MYTVPTSEKLPSVFASDRRACDRIDVAIWTRISLIDGSEYPARITNISAGGLMAMTPCPATDGVVARIKLPDIGWIEGAVAWNMGDRIGFEFDNIMDSCTFTKLTPYCL